MKAGFAALAMLVGLGACSQGSAAIGAVDIDAKSLEAHVAKLASETIKGDATAAADLASLRTLLPREVSVTWGSLNFDIASGATVLTDVKVTPADMPQIGLGIAELRLWDFDVALLRARMQGQRLNETARLARRIDAKNVSIFGLAEMMNAGLAPQAYDPYDYPPRPEVYALPPAEAPADPEMEAPAAPAAPLKFVPQDPEYRPYPPAPPSDKAPSIRNWPSITEPEFFEPAPYAQPDYYYEPPVSISVERYDISYSRLMLDDIMLKPYEAPTATGGMTMSSPLDALQGLVAFMRSVGIDTMGALDFKFDMAMRQGEELIAFGYTVKSMGSRGIRGADLDASYARDIAYTFDMGPDPSTPSIRRKIDFNVGFFGVEDVYFDKLLVEMAKGQAPSLANTDLMSLGLWRSENVSMSMAGKQLFSTAETSFDARKWHWLVPTDIQASAKGMVVDFEAIASLASMFQNSDYGYGFDDGVQEFLTGVEMMKRHGLSKPSMNFAFGWNWNPDNGDTRLSLGMGGDGLIDVDAKYEGSFPSYRSVTDVTPADPARANFDAIGRLFTERSQLKLIEVNVVDKGGLGKFFGLAAESGQAMGGFDFGRGPNALNGDQLREQASLLVQSMAVEASGQFPEVKGLLTPVANFLQSGGRLKMAMQPPQPMAFNALANVGAGSMFGTLTPSQVIQQMGIRTEHSK
jgi:hypothetical protein